VSAQLPAADLAAAWPSQSFFLYLLAAERSYLPPEVFLAPGGALLAPLLLRALALYWTVSRTPPKGAAAPADAPGAMHFTGLAAAWGSYAAGAVFFLAPGPRAYAGLGRAGAGGGVALLSAAFACGGGAVARRGVRLGWAVAKAQVRIRPGRPPPHYCASRRTRAPGRALLRCVSNRLDPPWDGDHWCHCSVG
jgi:hypothetical protein